MEKQLPLSFLISCSRYLVISIPFTAIVPLFILAVSGSSFMIVLHSTDFPQPDSPTMASTSPHCKEKETPRTACTCPCAVSKLTERFVISNRPAIAKPLLLSIHCPLCHIPENSHTMMTHNRIFRNPL